MSEWQPIETAPEDGTPVLIFSAKHGKNHKSPVALDFYHFRRDGWAYGGWYAIDNPTHWMPIPEPPK